ncbi:MAG: hypothetical protein IJ418_20160 [Clostridia bacterium]|nr:hypothetical protein [Clostridia bacterium]
MEEKLYLASRSGIAMGSLQGELLQRADLEGALALCAGEESLFCADRGGMIWRFDRRTLMPASLGCGGPGACAMCLSPCGRRLYALLGEGDSVLMSDGKSCRPLALNRCGSNPKSIICCGDRLVAAGGESCRVHIYCAKTLDSIDEVAMPGPVYSAALCDGVVYALCLFQDMHALLVAAQGEKRTMLRLHGMPGCLRVTNKCVLAATYGWLHVLSREGLRRIAVRDAPGKAGRILVGRNEIFLHDPISESVFAAQAAAPWRRLAGGVCDMCIA